ncbi:hypothetical protein D3C78_1778710 [compost metagenome]
MLRLRIIQHRTQRSLGLEQLRPRRIQPGIRQSVNTWLQHYWFRHPRIEVPQLMAVAEQQIKPGIFRRTSDHIAQIIINRRIVGEKSRHQLTP